MQFRATLLSGLLAGALPLAGRAQTEAPAAFKHHFFVGLGAAVGNYQMPYSVGNIISPMPTLGVQLRPRWAIQASGLYYGKEYSYDSPGQFFLNGKLQYSTYHNTSQRRIVAVPVLVRYTLSHRQDRRLQTDLLSGFAVAHSVFHRSSNTTDSMQAMASIYRDETVTTNVYFMLGTGLRYRLGQRLDLTGDFVFNFRLGNYRDYVSASRASATSALGLRYRFGRS